MKKPIFILLTVIFLLLQFCYSKKGPNKDIGSLRQFLSSPDSMNAGSQGETTTNDSSSDFIFKKYFKDSMPDYKLPEPNQFIEGYEDFTDKKIPYLCSGDFNGDGLKDFAVLTLKNDLLHLMAFNRTGPGFKEYHLTPNSEKSTY